MPLVCHHASDTGLRREKGTRRSATPFREKLERNPSSERARAQTERNSEVVKRVRDTSYVRAVLSRASI